MLLFEIHRPKNFKLNFPRSFLQIIVAIGEKYTINPLFNTVSVEKSKIEKCGSRPPPIVLSPSSKRDFQIAIFS